MKKHLLPLLFFLNLVASCKKDNPTSSNELLYQVIAKRGADSSVSTFWYDAQSRLSKYILEDGFGDQTYTLTVSRDNIGRVTRIIEDFKGMTPGTQTTDFFYLSDTDPRIRYGKFENDTPFIDSLVFEYSGSRVTSIKHYLSNGGPYILKWYYNYSYDSRNNITLLKFYEPDAGGTNFQSRWAASCTYDDKINPYYSNDDAFMEFLEFPWPCPNNMTSRSSNVSGPMLNITYEYRTDGRPTKRTSKINTQTTVYTYFYR
jgi:hypothetical protein